jgi:hypothetical protein
MIKDKTLQETYDKAMFNKAMETVLDPNGVNESLKEVEIKLKNKTLKKEKNISVILAEAIRNTFPNEQFIAKNIIKDKIRGDGLHTEEDEYRKSIKIQNNIYDINPELSEKSNMVRIKINEKDVKLWVTIFKKSGFGTENYSNNKEVELKKKYLNRGIFR